MRFLALVLAVAGMFLVGCGGPSSQILLQEALNHAAEESPDGWALAREKVEKVIQRGDVSAEALNLYAVVLARHGEADKALAAAARSAERYPEDFLSNYLLGIMFYDAGQYRDAVGPLRQAHAAKPENVDAHLLVTLASSRAGLPEAEALFEELIEIPQFAERAEIFNEWALFYLDQEQPEAALRIFTKARALPNVDPTVHLNLAVLYDRHLEGLPHRARLEMARRNYIHYLVGAQGREPQKSRQVQQRLRDLKSDHVSSL